MIGFDVFVQLTTVIRVSQAVSGETVMETLIERLMRTALEHAGGLPTLYRTARKMSAVCGIDCRAKYLLFLQLFCNQLPHPFDRRDANDGCQMHKRPDGRLS